MSTSRSPFSAWLNRDLPPAARITMKVWWPLLLLPLALLNQIFAPHPVWWVLLIVLFGLYIFGYLWVRVQVRGVTVSRERAGSLMVAGDMLREDLAVANDTTLPVLWAEITDESELPGYNANKVVACPPHGDFRWSNEVRCDRRGLYRLGPHRLTLGDPFGLFQIDVASDASDTLIIYPRVVQLPPLKLPHGNSSGSDMRRRPLRGTSPAAHIDEYRPGDSLRYIHWPTTARQGRLMIKELEIEPSGDVWIILDLNDAIHSGDGETSTLEKGVMLAAGLAAELLSGGERRAVGLLTVSGAPSRNVSRVAVPVGGVDDTPADAPPLLQRSDGLSDRAILLAPQAGQAQLWNILGALAPVQASDVTLSELLRNSREALGRRRTLFVVTGVNEPGVATNGHAREDNWLAELVHLRSLGLDSSVLLVAPAAEHPAGDEPAIHTDGAAAPVMHLLGQQEIPVQLFHAGEPMQSVLTFRRTRTVTRTTPTGGAVTYEIEEEVG